MTVTIKTKYLGELRTESLHVKSGSLVTTDAPVDNKGKGEAFSPTDLLATSLATCMLTIMGIAANNHGFSIDGADCDVTKIMSVAPRKIAEIIIEFRFPPNNFDEKQQQILRDAAYSCPVALSLSEDVKKTVRFGF
jgi:putative redox protein